MRECPSSPGLRTLHFHCQGSKVWVQSLIEGKKKEERQERWWRSGNDNRIFEAEGLRGHAVWEIVGEEQRVKKSGLSNTQD